MGRAREDILTKATEFYPNIIRAALIAGDSCH